MKKIFTILAIGLSSLYSYGQQENWVWNQKGMDIDGVHAQESSASSIGTSSDGLTVVVGANFNDDNGQDAGAVRIFSFDGTNWNQKGVSLLGDSIGDQFGSSVDISANGNTIVVGAGGSDVAAINAGLVRVFDWNGTVWVQRGADINGQFIADFAGGAISINASGDIIAIGTNSNAGGFNAGSTWVYEWNGSSWVQKGLGINGEAPSDFSSALNNSLSISVDGNVVAIGAYANDGNGTDAGHVRVYEWNGAAWSQRGLDLDGAAAGDQFGWSVSLSNNLTDIGSMVAIGAPKNDANGIDAGHVRVFRWTGSIWIQKGIDLVGEAAGDAFGTDVSLNSDGRILAAGATGNDGASSGAGHVRVYASNAITWFQRGSDIEGEAFFDGLGSSVSLNDDGTCVAAGSRGADSPLFSNSGHVRVYEVCAPTSFSFTVTRCDSYTVPSGDETYTTSTGGFIRDTIPNSCGGDSILFITININNSATGTDVQAACGGFIWINGTTYNASTNSPTFNLAGQAANGCDSLVTLNLTINNSTTGTDVQAACGSYMWINGTTYNSSTNSPTFNLAGQAANGCDSLVTLNLTINNGTAGTDVQTACGSYTWINGTTYNASTNSPTFNIVGGAANGCDSLVTLNLTINNSTTGTDVQTACGSYTWINGTTYNASTNSPTFNMSGGAANGCDSLVTLNLTINNSAAGTDAQTACGSYTWINGATYNSSTNSPTFNMSGAAANGCDSLVTLNLTVTTVDVTTTTTGFTITANETGATYQWIDCNNGNSMIVGETNASYTATTNGDYAVIVTVNSCIDTSACVNIATVGVSENAIVNQVSIYPNPTKGDVVFQLGNLKDVSLVVYSLTGKVVYQVENINTSTHQFNLNSAAGFYIVNVTANGTTQQFKLIKE